MNSRWWAVSVMVFTFALGISAIFGVAVMSVDRAAGATDENGSGMLYLPIIEGNGRAMTGTPTPDACMQANDYSNAPSISADGRYVAFASLATNLVPDDTSLEDVFVYDRQTRKTTWVSVSSTGTRGNGYSNEPSMSADGRYVAFSSAAGNLVSDDTNVRVDVFVHEQQTQETKRVSVSSNGMQGETGSAMPSISADGRYVAFIGSANDLVPDDTNDVTDIFVHDRQTGETSRVSVSNTDAQGNELSLEPSISGDGRYVAFSSWASNLVANDTNDGVDIFVHDQQTGETNRVSVSSDGMQGDAWSQQPSISADGRYVAFTSLATNLVPDDTNDALDVFVHDRQTGETSRVSVSNTDAQGNERSFEPSISGDGRYVAFTSWTSNLVPNDTNDTTDIFVHDRQTGETNRVSVSSDGMQGDAWSYQPSISADGRYVAFLSLATNLVPDDTNRKVDIFVHDKEIGTTTRVSVSCVQ